MLPCHFKQQSLPAPDFQRLADMHCQMLAEASDELTVMLAAIRKAEAECTAKPSEEVCHA